MSGGASSGEWPFVNGIGAGLEVARHRENDQSKLLVTTVLCTILPLRTTA